MSNFQRGIPIKWRIKAPRKGIASGVVYDDYSHEGYLLVRYIAGPAGVHSSKILKVPLDRVIIEEKV